MEDLQKIDDTAVNPRIIGTEFCLLPACVMSGEDSLKNSRGSAPFLLAFIFLLMVDISCSRAETRANAQAQAPPATQTREPQSTSTFQSCPAGNNEVPPTTSSGTSLRKVHLTWIESTSRNDPRFGEIRYCIYRSQEKPVLKKAAVFKDGEAPCTNCQLVTPDPVAGTEFTDKYVDDNAHYCYVAIAVPAKTDLRSDFSNQAGAFISLGASPPSCDLKPNQTKVSSSKAHTRK